jgi:hypothetical protein
LTHLDVHGSILRIETVLEGLDVHESDAPQLHLERSLPASELDLNLQLPQHSVGTDDVARVEAADVESLRTVAAKTGCGGEEGEDELDEGTRLNESARCRVEVELQSHAASTDASAKVESGIKDEVLEEELERWKTHSKYPLTHSIPPTRETASLRTLGSFNAVAASWETKKERVVDGKRAAGP